MDDLILDPISQLVTVNDSSPTVSVQWDQAVQEAVINTSPGPTVASRAYGVLHTAMFDAWAAYDPNAVGTQLGDDLQRPTAENTDANKTEAMSFAAYRVLTELFPSEQQTFDDLMTELGLDPNNTSTDTTTAAGIGNVSAEALMAFRRNDGSNQENGYVDTTGYTPVNSDSDNIVDIAAWTPEFVPIDSEPGDANFARQQQFLTPQWSIVEPFALESSSAARPVAPESFLLVEGATVDLEARTITLADDTVVDIDLSIVGTDPAAGAIINQAFVEQAQQVVDTSRDLTDEQKLVAEFWEDGGGTSFPPGTWMTFGQFVSARDNHTVDQDAVLFAALGNAVFDAGVATWEAKVFYDYARPVRAIRDLGNLGLLNNGATGTDAITGETGFVIDAWAGPGLGTETILADNFLTYQTPGGDPSPPFAEYTSGHSAFSASGAEILRSFTGSDTFGASVTFDQGESRFEPGVTPTAATSPLTLQWDTFSEAADEAGISRIYGGIHFDDGDQNGRTLGREVGSTVWEQLQLLTSGGENESISGSTEGDELIAGAPNDDGSITLDGLDDVVHTGAGADDVELATVLTNAVAGGNRVNTGSSDDVISVSRRDRVYGSVGDDTFDAELSEGRNRMSGGAGDDDFILGGSRDRALGGAGSDTFEILSSSSRNILAGGADADLFFFGADGGDLITSDQSHQILDFVSGTDLLEFGIGITAADVTVSGGANALLSIFGFEIATFSGVNETSLNTSVDSATFA
jgi:hypothetical protein